MISLKELEDLIKENKTELNKIDLEMKEGLCEENNNEIEKFNNIKINDKIKYKKVPEYTFTKTNRFNNKVKYDNKNYDIKVKSNIKGGIISKSQKQNNLNKVYYNSKMKINPKIDYIKKNNNCYVNMKKKENTLKNDSIVSKETTDTYINIGPGCYNPKYDKVLKSNNKYTIAQSKRFKEEKVKKNKNILDNKKKDNKTNITLNNNIKGTLIKPKIGKEKKIIEFEKNQNKIQDILNIKINNKWDKLKNINEEKNKKIKNITCNNTNTEQNNMARIFKILDEIKKFSYEKINFEPKKNNKCLVTYKKKNKSISPDFQKLMDNKVGPGYYEVKDDLCKPKTFIYKIKKDIYQKPKKIDMKRPLDINYNQTEKNVQVHKIIKENPINKDINDFDFRIGPGNYDVNYNLIDTNIKGNIKYKNDYFDSKEIIDEKNILNPNLNLVKKKIPNTIIKKEIVKKLPPNIPDKELYRDKWEFYDYDIDKIRENYNNLPNFSNNLKFEEFKIKEHEKEIAIKYFKLMNYKVPQIGDYDPIFKLVEKNINIPNFNHYLERSFLEDNKDNKHANLNELQVFDPKLPEKHLPNIKFENYLNRELNNDIKENNLEYQVDYDISNAKEKKIKGFIDFNKQLDKSDIFKKPDTEIEINYSINYKHIEDKVKNLTNFDKNQGRSELYNTDKNELVNELILEKKSNFIKKKIPNVVNMEKITGREELFVKEDALL